MPVWCSELVTGILHVTEVSVEFVNLGVFFWVWATETLVNAGTVEGDIGEGPGAGKVVVLDTRKAFN